MSNKAFLCVPWISMVSTSGEIGRAVTPDYSRAHTEGSGGATPTRSVIP